MAKISEEDIYNILEDDLDSEDEEWELSSNEWSDEDALNDTP